MVTDIFDIEILKRDLFSTLKNLILIAIGPFLHGTQHPDDQIGKVYQYVWDPRGEMLALMERVTVSSRT